MAHSKTFKTAAQKQQPYVFDYNREVADFYRDHPEQKKKIFFIDSSSLPASLLRGDETDEDAVSEILATNGDLYAAIKRTYIEGISGSVRLEDYDCVILKAPRSKNGFNLLGHSTAPDIVDVFTFDHEVGHLICPDGRENTKLQECVADAYAVLRHFQRFGINSASIKKLADMRAAEMIFGKEGSHFTSPVVERIIADSAKMDFSTLTPAATAALAQRYAQGNAPEPMFVKYMVDEFSACGCGVMDLKKEKFNTLRTLCEFVLTTTVPEEFKYGAAAIRTVLDGQLGFNGACLPLPAGEEWMRVRQALDARAARFDLPQPKLVVSYGSNHLKPK